MKRLLGGALVVLAVISLVANVCFADIAGPWWPRTSITSTGSKH